MYQPAISPSYLKQLIGVSITSIPKPHVREHNRELRKVLLEIDPYCYYCSIRLTLDDSTLDHAIPKSKGGRTNQENCCLACFDCNQKKGRKVVILWGR